MHQGATRADYSATGIDNIMLTLSPGRAPALPKNISDIWLALLGFAIPVSVALQNIIAFGGLTLIFVFAIWNRQLHLNRWCYAILATSAFFFLSEFIHDGSLSRTGNLLLVMLAFVLAAQHIKVSLSSLQYLAVGLLIGLFVGLGIDEYRRPEYTLWATSAAKYANEAGFLALVTMFLTFFLATPWRWLSIAACLWFIDMTGAKASMIAAACGLGIFILIRYSNSHSMKKFLLVFSGLLVIAIPATIHFSNETIHLSTEQPRIDLIEHGLKIAQHDHWLGRGEHQFSKAEIEDLHQWLPLGNGFFSSSVRGMSPIHGSYNVPFHNLFMHALVEHGIAGLIVLLLFFALPFFIFFSNPVATDEVAIGLAIWTAFCIHSFFELGLYNASAILIGLVAGLTGIFGNKREQL